MYDLATELILLVASVYFMEAIYYKKTNYCLKKNIYKFLKTTCLRVCKICILLYVCLAFTPNKCSFHSSEIHSKSRPK